MKLKKHGGGLPYEIFIKGISLVVVIIVLVTTLYTASQDIYGQKENLYIFSAIFPLIIAFLFLLKDDLFLSELKNKMKRFALLIVPITVIFYFMYKFLGVASLFILFYMMINVLIFVIGLISLAILYNMFSNYLMKVGGYPKILILLIFYIPCLIIDFLNFMKEEYKITPSITTALIFLEILFITVYFMIRRFGAPQLNRGTELYKGKVFLDTKTELHIPHFPNLIVNSDNLMENERDLSLKNYTLSLWVYINQPEFNEQSFPIFCYGNDKNPKPLMMYEYDNEQKQYVINIKLSGGSSIKVLIKNQNWNYFVFNYNGSTVNLFLNGILVRSIDLSNALPVYEVSDTIIIGSNKTGIYGSIADVNYYVTPLSQLQILGNYRLGINLISL